MLTVKYTILKSSFAVALGTAAIVGGTLAATPANAQSKAPFNRFVPAKHPFNVGMFIPWSKDVE